MPTQDEPRPAQHPTRRVRTQRATIRQGLGLVVAPAAGVTTLVGAIGDVLVPLGGFLTLVMAGLSALLLLICLVGLLPMHLVTRTRGTAWLQATGSKLARGYWGRPIVAALALSTGVSLAAWGITNAAPPGGFVGSQIPAVHDIQVSIGLLNAHLADVADDTQAIREDTARIQQDVSDINQAVGSLEQETSVDPRKELANLGVAWSADAFVEALTSGDVRTAKLFLEGDMQPTVVHKGASAVVYLLQPGWPDSPLPMLNLLADEGFDFDEALIDSSIMASYSDLLPGTFENVDPPVQIYGGTFEGPALLWVVMVASYFGPTDHDMETINFLLDRDVDPRLAKAYMRFSASWNSDNWPFAALWPVIFDDSGETPPPTGDPSEP